MDIKSLQKLTTKRLLAFYNAERKRQLKPSYNEDENYYGVVSLNAVKKILDSREHIEKTKEGK